MIKPCRSRISQRTFASVLLLVLSACSSSPKATTSINPPGKVSATAAQAYWDKFERDVEELDVRVNEAQWAAMTNITDETEAAASAASEEYMAFTSKTFKESMAFKGVQGSPALERAFKLLTSASYAPSPDDAKLRKELASVMTKMEGLYGKGKYCEGEGALETCKDLGELSDVLKESRDYDELTRAWAGWRTISPEIKPLYERFVQIANMGAKEIGMSDVGEGWRSWYDMPTSAFPNEIDKLWAQVKPLYEDLHCYARAKLAKQYPERFDPKGEIPAHLVGNMWAQDWTNIYDILQPYASKVQIDIDGALESQGYDALKMVRTGEAFFTSLGMKPLPPSFFEKSMFVKPENREVVCHASAWDVQNNDDVRIKMCIKPTEEDLITIHHELGHIYYYLYYNNLPNIFQSGAHDGFHEAIGDVIALSMTDEYYEKIGLLKKAPQLNEKELVNAQMRRALEKIAFLPFGRMIDQWRWDVFAGKVAPADYNKHWWKLRSQYQGIKAPIARAATDFDPGAKYHIPGNTPYMRYFMSFILQFQMHKALCEASGHEGPLHTCSIHESQEAGEKMMALLKLGQSQPWQDALEAMTGSRTMDASALLEYFAPLQGYLKEANQGQTCGW